MPKIIDLDLLIVNPTAGFNLTLDTTGKTFTLNVAGTLIAKDGVSGQALYSKFVELWTTANYNKYPFPAYVIGDPRAGMFVFGFDGAAYNGWKPGDDSTRQMLRDIGWGEYTVGGVLSRQHVGVSSLGDVSNAAQLYLQRTTTGVPINFTYNDEVNEGIQVFGDASNGSFDERTFFKTFCREYAKTYSSANLALIGETGTGPFKIGMPITNSDDLKITDTDAVVAANATYIAIKIKYFTGAYQREIDTNGTPRNFGIVADVGTHSGIDGSVTSGGNVLSTAAAGIVGADYVGGKLTVHEGGAAKGTYNISGTPAAGSVTITGTFGAVGTSLSFTLQRATPIVATKAQIYTKIQYSLRQNTNINGVTGNVVGKTADQTLTFSGDQLEAGRYIPTNSNGGGSGVFVEGFAADDATTIDFYDNTGIKRNFPFNATGVLNFNGFLTQGGIGYYRMYFTTLPGAANYGTAIATTVNDAAGNPITGIITSGSIPFTFAYDTNVQGTRTSASNAPITIIAGNPGSAKPVVATYTITRAVGQGITLTAEQDRGYSNPV